MICENEKIPLLFFIYVDI